MLSLLVWMCYPHNTEKRDIDISKVAKVSNIKTESVDYIKRSLRVELV